MDKHERRELCANINFPALVARDGFQLIQRGASLRSAFRPERTPSVHIRQEEDGWRWFDFGSGNGGDVLSYLCDIRGLPFRDALAELKALAGVILPEPRITSAMEREGLWENAEAKERPESQPGTRAQHEALAALRKVSVSTVTGLGFQGVVSFGEHRKRPAFFLHGTRELFQAKRLDGFDWWEGTKALFIGQSSHRWIEATVGAAGDCFLVLEGCVSVLEGAELLRRAGMSGTVIALPSANAKIPAALAGKLAVGRCLILADGDPPGKGAGERWFVSIQAAGGERIRWLNLPDGMDAGDLLSESPATITAFLHENFTHPTS
jgi:hypothetical protein